MGGLPVLLVVLEPRSDSTQSAVLALRHAAPQGISALVLGGTALPLVSSLGEGQLVVISDHINLLGHHPLVDRTTVELGHGFPDMSRAYDERLRECVESEAAALSQSAGHGVYLACEEDMDATDPFVRAAVDAGACVRGSGIAPIAVLGAALRVPVVAAILVNGNAACHGAPDACSREERKTMLAQALARGVFGVREEYRTEVGSHGALRSRETHTAVLTKSRTSVVLRVS
ncbi:MAG: hypothetical protein IT364_07150 [Candidatus Hydrogenedentes bacterium]|nr:hypothetical protein [Candidatus Hydrogenedentota bacterium]